MKSKITSLFLLIALLSSCGKDFLYQGPETDLVAESYYKTKEHYDQAFIAASAGLRTVAYMSFFIDEMRSDNAHFDYYAPNRGTLLSHEVIAYFLNDDNSGNPIFNTYNGCYTAIQRLNTALDRMPLSDLTAQEAKNATAQLKFLRAYFYFVLVRNFGGVPLQLKEVAKLDDALLPRSTEAEVYAQIIKDLDVSVADLPAPKFPGDGRPTKGTALTVRAHCYLQKTPKEPVKAEADLKALAALGYDLLPKYDDCFLLSNKNNKEMIFSAQYKDGTDGQHNSMPWRLIPKCSNNVALMGVNQANTSGESGGFVTPEANFLKSYEPDDKRLDATVGVVIGKVTNEIIAYRTIGTMANYQSLMQAGESAKFFCRKYYHPPYTNTGSKTGENVPFYRYGTALLMLAEALMEQNKATEALPIVNRVRTRAGLPPLTVLSKEALMLEQRHENAYEMHRWQELKRYGVVVPVMTAFGEELKKKYGYLTPDAFTNIGNKLLYPFQFNQLQLNPNLEQNPY